MCYVTLRGLVYFGASIHLYNGVQMLVNMYYDLFANSVSKLVTVSNVDIIFNCTFFTLGVLIFRGVEQQSKNFIKWPTIGFTLLLASRFIVEIIKQMGRDSETMKNGQGVGDPLMKSTLSPFSYSSMSIDVDPLISAAVGIYIFILFVYNHSLEYCHTPNPTTSDLATTSSNNRRTNLQFSHNNRNRTSSCSGSDCMQSDGSSDTVQLINTTARVRIASGGDSNNNGGAGRQSVVMTLNERGGPPSPGNLLINAPMSTISNPLFELDSRGHRQSATPPNHLSLRGNALDTILPMDSSSEEKIEAV